MPFPNGFVKHRKIFTRQNENPASVILAINAAPFVRIEIKVAGLTVGDATACKDIIDRLRESASANSDRQLATALGLKLSSISTAKSKGIVHPSWIINAANLFGVSADWLIFGKGNANIQESAVTAAPLPEPMKVQQPAPPKQIYDNQHEVFDIPRQAVDKWAMEISPTAFKKLWDEFRSSTRSKQGWTQIELVERFPEFVRWLEQKFGLDEEDEDFEPKLVRGIKAKRQDENDDLDLRFDYDFNSLHPKR
ncbi:hypothetical protein C4J81_06170 [Deltaproteobacteria bacterium Smac51]|nr:hypothetical protein C4J81_06170 [Deltaproteobacteria bacterium Smac51]